MNMDYKLYLTKLEYINQEITHFEYILGLNDHILWNPFSKDARWRRALWNKIEELNREIGALNYQFHGDESFPNPVDLVDKVRQDDQPFW